MNVVSNQNKEIMNKEEIKTNLEENSSKNTIKEKIDYSKYIKFTYKKKEKSYLSDMLFQMEENDNKLKNEIVKTCSNNCFANLNCDFLSGNENICLINCFKKFGDSVHIGEKLQDDIDNGRLRKTLLLKGDFERFRTDALSKLI